MRVNLNSPDIIKVLMPQPTIYNLTYKTERGEVRHYDTVVIEKHEGYFTGYVYGRGVRNFRYERVLDLKPQ